MKRFLRLVGAAVVAGSPFVLVVPVAGAQVQPAPSASASERHRVHCEDLVGASSRSDHDQQDGPDRDHDADDECGPPPMVPEVPVAVLLPLTGGAIAAVTYGIRRRQGSGRRPTIAAR